MNVKLIRLLETQHGHFGQVQFNNKSLFTLERLYQNNAPYLSSVPEASYQLVTHYSDKYKGVLSLVNEEIGVYHYPHPLAQRTSILIHSANFVEQLNGCIALGTEIGIVNGKIAVLNSRQAIKMFYEVVKDGDVIEITRCKCY